MTVLISGVRGQKPSQSLTALSMEDALQRRINKAGISFLPASQQFSFETSHIAQVEKDKSNSIAVRVVLVGMCNFCS